MDDPELDKILVFLNQEQIRATYGAVAALLGILPRSMGVRLGPHSLKKSWIVNADSGEPTGYTTADIHPALKRNSEIIRTAVVLRRRMTSATRR